ncbi:TlpA family protein disulfide reductase [Novosphingobium marinum]|nr:TlpA disulfide reductase family protein [Novosphingobium marinum]
MAGGCDRQSTAPAQPGDDAGKSNAPSLAGVIDRSRAGQPIPDFTVSTADGESLSLPSLRGKPVLLNLWATWCAPCVVELPTLDEVAAKRGEELKVLTVSQDTGRASGVADFLREKGGDNLEAWLDPENQLSFHYATGTLPTTVLYDAQGREVWRYVGGMEWNDAKAAEMLAEGL